MESVSTEQSYALCSKCLYNIVSDSEVYIPAGVSSVDRYWSENQIHHGAFQ